MHCAYRLETCICRQKGVLLVSPSPLREERGLKMVNLPSTVLLDADWSTAYSGRIVTGRFGEVSSGNIVRFWQ